MNENLDVCRQIALEHALYGDGTCSIENVRARAEQRGLNIDFSEPWTGSIFKGGRWQIADFPKASHDGAHGRRVTLWRLKDSARPKPTQTEMFGRVA